MDTLELTAAGISRAGWVVFGFRSGPVIAKTLDGHFLFVWGPGGDEVLSVAFPDENSVAIGTPWVIHIYDHSRKANKLLRLDRCWLKALASSKMYLAAGVQMNSSGFVSQIHLWRLYPSVSAYPVRVDTPQDLIKVLALSADGHLLVSGSWDGTVYLWHIGETGWGEPPRVELIGPLGNPAHTARVLSIAISPDEKIIATSSHDGTLRLWNQDGLLDTMRYREDYWYNLAFSLDGHSLLGQSRYIVTKWNLKTGTSIAREFEKKVAVAGFVEDRGIAIAFQDGTTDIWYPK